jgi:hypothetical protein
MPCQALNLEQKIELRDVVNTGAAGGDLTAASDQWI